MHLLEAPAFAFHIDQHRRIDAGHARGGHQHIAEQIERAGRAARRDRAHVPHGGALRVEIGGHDQEPAASLVFGADALEQRVIHIARDQALERLGLEHARAENRRQSVDLEQFLSDAFGEQALEHGIVGGPRNANGAISAPALAPVTTAKSGRPPRSVQPASRPAP